MENNRSKRIVIGDNKSEYKINSVNINMFDAYRDYMSEHLTDKTAYSYEMDIIAWLKYIVENHGNKPLDKIEEYDIEMYLIFCRDGGNKDSRLKRRLAAIRSMYKYLRKYRFLNNNPCEFVEI